VERGHKANLIGDLLHGHSGFSQEGNASAGAGLPHMPSRSGSDVPLEQANEVLGRDARFLGQSVDGPGIGEPFVEKVERLLNCPWAPISWAANRLELKRGQAGEP
jgi:hypothetical protein